MLTGVPPATLAGALTPAQLTAIGAALTQPQLDYIASKLVVPVPPVLETARLLYRIDFAGVSLAPITEAWNQGAWQDLVGTTADVWGGGLRLLSLTDPIQVTAATVESVITHMIDPLGRNGPALRSTILRSQNGTDPQGTAVMQAALHFLPKHEEPTLYVSEWLKLQPDLVEVMAAAAPTNAGWRVVFTFKTGGQFSGGPSNDGDYRFQLSVQTRDRPQPYWVLLADNNAGGNAALVNNFALKNFDVPVPVGEWFRLEVYWRRSSGADGRFWVAVNGRVVFDRLGPNMGALGMPINRIYAPILYSGSRLPIYQWVDDVEVWDGFPLSATAHA